MLFYREYGDINCELLVFMHGGFTTSEILSHMKQYNAFKDFHFIFTEVLPLN